MEPDALIVAVNKRSVSINIVAFMTGAVAATTVLHSAQLGLLKTDQFIIKNEKFKILLVTLVKQIIYCTCRNNISTLYWQYMNYIM